MAINPLVIEFRWNLCNYYKHILVLLVKNYYFALLPIQKKKKMYGKGNLIL